VQISSRTLNFHYTMTRISGTLHEDQYTFSIISRSILLKVLNVSDKFVDKIKTRFYVQFFFLSKIVSFMREIMWKSRYFRARQVTVDNMGHARCVLVNESYKHSQDYVILIGFPL
jgi:hypothetical protein